MVLFSVQTLRTVTKDTDVTKIAHHCGLKMVWGKKKMSFHNSLRSHKLKHEVVNGYGRQLKHRFQTFRRVVLKEQTYFQ